VFTDGGHGDITLMLLQSSLPEHYFNVVRAVLVLVQLQLIGTWTFAQAMNFMTMTLLYDQFVKLSEEFSKCVICE